jgi:hypothetical protein
MDEHVSRQASEVNGLNFKLLYDDTSSDISINRKSLMRHQDAWETLRLRNSQFAASFDHALLAAVAIANQTGSTESQAAVTPIKQGAGDAQNQQPAGAVYPPIRNVDQSGAAATAGIMTAQEQVAANIAALSDVVTKFADAMAAVLLTAAGGASTPSQTKPPTTGTAG